MDHEKTVDAASYSRGSFCPSSASSLSLSIREGAGKAGWPHAPGAPAQKKFARAREPQVQAVTTGPPCAVVYGLYALSPVNHSVCHRHRRDAQASSPTWRQTLGRQDHTISPSVKERRSSVSAFTSTAFRSTFVTIAIRPLCRRGTGES